MTSEVNELSNVKDVGGTMSKMLMVRKQSTGEC